MFKHFLKESLGYGLALWFIGYVLGFVMFFLVPKDLIGWILMPIGIAITIYCLTKYVKTDSIKGFVQIGVVWTIIAIVCDYLFLVKLLKPEDGYYKLDVYLYYVLTLIIPIVFGLVKSKKGLPR